MRDKSCWSPNNGTKEKKGVPGIVEMGERTPAEFKACQNSFAWGKNTGKEVIQGTHGWWSM